MGNVKVNTDSVIAAANKIKGYNNQIRTGFSSVQSAISSLDASWDGSAATSAIRRFNEIKAKYPDSRYNVVDNFVVFLLKQVGEGYTKTEDDNTSLADAFKQ